MKVTYHDGKTEEAAVGDAMNGRIALVGLTKEDAEHANFLPWFAQEVRHRFVTTPITKPVILSVITKRCNVLHVGPFKNETEAREWAKGRGYAQILVLDLVSTEGLDSCQRP